jgi:N6-L-threonylcarbamoyladenine synthase
MKVKEIMALYTSCCMLLWNARSIRSLTTSTASLRVNVCSASHTEQRISLLQSRARNTGRGSLLRLWSSQSTQDADRTDSSTPTPETTATSPDVQVHHVDVEHIETEKAARKRRAKEKRKKFIGLAKAVDRGQFAVTYCPGGTAAGADSFQALSGLPDRSRPFTVLGIESSCDDTGAAVVRSDGVLLGEALASQQEIHEAWGGVVPGLARDAHVAQIDRVVEMALQQAGMTSAAEVDAISVTVGPGLEICLRVGCTKAVELAVQYNKPFVGIHHLEAHILMARLPLLDNNDKDDNFQSSLVQIPATADTHASVRSMDFPFLALLVSGGHCQLMKCLGIGNYEIIGGTLDDSLGEAFDKTARMLGLPTGGGGGPAVEKLALIGDPKAAELPIPLIKRKDCDFSYAGLKTAVRKAAEKLAVERGVETTEELPVEDKANIAASFQNVAIRHIEMRLNRAMDLLEPEGIRTLAVVGGVAANTELRTRLQAVCANRGRNGPPEAEQQPWTMLVPPPRLCTDQGSMSAWAGVERIMVGSSDDPTIQEVHARYPFSSNINTPPPL